MELCELSKWEEFKPLLPPKARVDDKLFPYSSTLYDLCFTYESLKPLHPKSAVRPLTMRSAVERFFGWLESIYNNSILETSNVNQKISDI